MRLSPRLLALLGAAACTLATATPPALAAADPTAAGIRAHMAFLSDDLMEGRATGARGFDLAARYVASRFEALGLQPGGTGGTWYQPITFTEASPVIPAAVLTLTRNGQDTVLKPAEDFLPGADYFAPKREVTAPLVFVGFGVHAPELGYDDYAGVDVRGKIAVVVGGAPSHFPSTARAHYSNRMTKARELVARGAVGQLGMSLPEDLKRVPWERSVRLSWVPAMRWLQADGSPSDAFPELQAGASLGPSAMAPMFAGAAHGPEEIYTRLTSTKEQAARPLSFDLPGTATLHRETLSSKRQSMNVIGLLPGQDPALRDEYVVITAHLDHIGKGAAINGDSIYNGALDNASGVAVMLEVARLLAESPQRRRRSVIFIALTGEEKGLLGSDYYARNPTVPLERVVANINMDMPVFLVPGAAVVAFGADHSTLGAVAAKAAKQEGVLLTPDEQPEETIFVRSDQYSFVKAGIPALYLDNGMRSSITGVDGKAPVKDFLANHYHMPSDDMSRPIDFQSLARFARLNVRVIRAVANNHERPRWHKGDFFGERFGTELTKAK
jgi:Peptidase family M28